MQNPLLCLLFHNTSPPDMRTSYKQAPEQRSRSKLGVLKNRTINLFPVKHQMRRSHWRRQEGNRNQKKSRTMEPQIKTPIDPLLLILICFCGDAAAACYTESVRAKTLPNRLRESRELRNLSGIILQNLVKVLIEHLVLVDNVGLPVIVQLLPHVLSLSYLCPIPVYKLP